MANMEETMAMETQATETQIETNYYDSDNQGTALDIPAKDKEGVDIKSAIIGGAITAVVTTVAYVGKKGYDAIKGRIAKSKLKKEEKEDIEKLKAELAAIKAEKNTTETVVEVKPEDIKPEEETKEPEVKDPKKNK